MKKFKSNLKARYIKMTEDDIYMVRKIAERKLKDLAMYRELPEEIRNIITSNVLIIATTDNVKRADNKADIIIGNLNDATKLVMSDVSEGTAQVLKEDKIIRKKLDKKGKMCYNDS